MHDVTTPITRTRTQALSRIINGPPSPNGLSHVRPVAPGHTHNCPASALFGPLDLRPPGRPSPTNTTPPLLVRTAAQQHWWKQQNQVLAVFGNHRPRIRRLRRFGESPQGLVPAPWHGLRARASRNHTWRSCKHGLCNSNKLTTHPQRCLPQLMPRNLPPGNCPRPPSPRRPSLLTT